MAQETPNSQRSAVDFVIDAHKEYRAIEQAMKQAEFSGDDDRLASLHSNMENIQGYDIKNRAEQLLSGLGFHANQFKNLPQPFEPKSINTKISIDIIQARLVASLNELKSYILSRISQFANVSILIEPNIFERTKVEFVGYVAVAPNERSFIDPIFNVSDLISLNEKVIAIIEAKLRSLQAEGKIIYQRVQTQQILQQAILEPILFLKKLDTILGVYPFPEQLGKKSNNPIV
jgi:hypothetical protein